MRRLLERLLRRRPQRRPPPKRRLSKRLLRRPRKKRRLESRKNVRNVRKRKPSVKLPTREELLQKLLPITTRVAQKPAFKKSRRSKLRPQV